MRVIPEVRGETIVIDQVLPDTTAGRDAAAEIRQGLMRGLSVSFQGGAAGTPRGRAADSCGGTDGHRARGQSLVRCAGRSPAQRGRRRTEGGDAVALTTLGLDRIEHRQSSGSDKLHRHPRVGVAAAIPRRDDLRTRARLARNRGGHCVARRVRVDPDRRSRGTDHARARGSGARSHRERRGAVQARRRPPHGRRPAVARHVVTASTARTRTRRRGRTIFPCTGRRNRAWCSALQRKCCTSGMRR